MQSLISFLLYADRKGNTKFSVELLLHRQNTFHIMYLNSVLAKPKYKVP